MTGAERPLEEGTEPGSPRGQAGFSPRAHPPFPSSGLWLLEVGWKQVLGSVYRWANRSLGKG